LKKNRVEKVIARKKYGGWGAQEYERRSTGGSLGVDELRKDAEHRSAREEGVQGMKGWWAALLRR
jgi:hypothetical protein